ncbi:rhodanese-like domain-containing protein [Spirulina subsalsa]|uniref:rhodanese-like domain-containing protein n=1 Tax=Spirulina subsalsa TaxID=54311 RepID=UPI0002F8A36A|nr:rhodanese-like domain-containing protein [Spirulina subsalsa]
MVIPLSLFYHALNPLSFLLGNPSHAQLLAQLPPSLIQTKSPSSELFEMTVQELKPLVDHQSKKFVLLDVRNPDEHNFAKLRDSVLIPLPEIQQGFGVEKLKKVLNGRPLVVYCRTGNRSAEALAILQKHGIQGTNLKGGILAWSQEIDPSVPQY